MLHDIGLQMTKGVLKVCNKLIHVCGKRFLWMLSLSEATAEKV